MLALFITQRVSHVYTNTRTLIRRSSATWPPASCQRAFQHVVIKLRSSCQRLICWGIFVLLSYTCQQSLIIIPSRYENCVTHNLHNFKLVLCISQNWKGLFFSFADTLRFYRLRDMDFIIIFMLYSFQLKICLKSTTAVYQGIMAHHIPKKETQRGLNFPYVKSNKYQHGAKIWGY